MLRTRPADGARSPIKYLVSIGFRDMQGEVKMDTGHAVVYVAGFGDHGLWNYIGSGRELS